MSQKNKIEKVDKMEKYKNFKKKKSNYISFKLNGKLFPTWILANFSRYKLPEIFLDGSDPCSNQKISNKLKKYQEFLGKYLDFNSPYRDILIYHGLGSGKTRSAINIYNMLYNYSPDWNVYILLKATLKESTWVRELEKWLQEDEKEFRKNNIEFVSYDAPNADKIFLEKVKNADAAKKSMYIIDESHNFINNVYTNISTKHGRRALTIYDHIIQDKKDNDSVRVILISGSPAVNTPFELALLFNLLRPGIFPTSESQFNQLYISTRAYPVINVETKNNFQRRIMGLVSYYVGSTPEVYAKKIINYIDVPMSDYQELIYSHYEQIEEKIARRLRDKKGNYKSYTRQSCNFVFPIMGQGMSGETRPRPRDFKIKESEIDIATKGTDIKNDKKKDKYYKVNEYLEKVDEFVLSFDRYLKTKLDDDIANKHTLADDMKKFINIAKSQFDIDDYVKFINSSENKSELLMALHNCSAKMTFMIFNIFTSPGPVLVYSNYVAMEGLQIFKIYLKYWGFVDHKTSSAEKDHYRYMEYHGGIDPIERRKVLEEFNVPENKIGAIAKIIMISPAGAEGISLNNVRQVHIMEPYWHEVRIEQMIGRAIRQCSHRDLPLEEREVMVFRYKSVRKNGKWTTDQYIEDMARSKEGLIQSFLDAMKEVAIDCVLNSNHNNIVSAHRCFQFEEKSLFDEYIGPAYKEDLEDDLKFNNGLNAPNSKVSRIKVIKIRAVKQLKQTDDGDGELYSEPENYWYNPNTNIVYNNELLYPIGKVGVGEDDMPIKLDNKTFVITKMIPLPIIKK